MPLTYVGTVLSWITGCAIHERGSCSTFARSSSSSALRGLRPDHDALAAGAVDRLEHQLVEAVHDLLAVVGVAQPPGVDVLQDRLLVEVVAHQVGEVGVDQLVVGDAVADGVGDRHVAGAGGVEQARAAEQRVAAEVHRVEELVVDPAVDHVHRLEALRRTHHHAAAAALEVTALDQLDAHGAGQQRVLEVGAVEDAGREHDDVGVGDTGRCGGAQGGEQLLRVAGDRADPVLGEGLGQGRGDRPAVGHHVGDTGGHAHVVLEHPELALVVADQVDAADVHAHAVGRLDAGGRAVEVRGGGDHPARDDAVLEHPAGVVDVVEELLQRVHPLLDAGLDLGPLVHLDDPGEDVEREGALLAADVEGDALVEVARLQRLDPALQLGLAHLRAGTVAAGCTACGARPPSYISSYGRAHAGRVVLEHARHPSDPSESVLRRGPVSGPVRGG